MYPQNHISPLADIEVSQRGSQFLLGEGCFIDSFVKVKFVGGTGDIVLGKSVYINSGCVLYSGNGITIGNNVSIAANCTFAPVNHEYSSRSMCIQQQRFKKSKGGIIIKNDVWIGANCVLLDGTFIEEGVIIGAGSLIRGHITQPHTLWGGNPLRKLGERG